MTWLMFGPGLSFAQDLHAISNIEAHASSHCDMTNYVEGALKSLPLKCQFKQQVLPAVQLRQVCLQVISLNCDDFNIQAQRTISFTGLIQNVSWVMHWQAKNDKQPNGLMSLMKQKTTHR